MNKIKNKEDIKDLVRRDGVGYLGEVEIESGSIIATDPCYKNEGKNLHTVVDNVANGTWHGFVKYADLGDWGHRVSRVYLVRDPDLVEKYLWHKVSNDICVDSGQAGFFDLKHYNDDTDSALDFDREAEDIIRDEKFYSMVCDLSMRDVKAGVYKHGVNASSGVGDGIYALHGIKENDEYVGFYIEFIRGDER